MKEVEWEIVDHVDSQLPPEIGDVTDLSMMQDMKLSKQEEFVRETLKDYTFEKKYYVKNDEWVLEERTELISADPASMLKAIFDDANSVITQNNNWDTIPDYKARANLKIKILESMGVIKPKQKEVTINFLSLLFWKK